MIEIGMVEIEMIEMIKIVMIEMIDIGMTEIEIFTVLSFFSQPTNLLLCPLQTSGSSPS